MISQNRGGKGIEERGVKRKMRTRDRGRYEWQRHKETEWDREIDTTGKG